MKLQARNFVVRKPETIDITMFFKKFCIATRTSMSVHNGFMLWTLILLFNFIRFVCGEQVLCLLTFCLMRISLWEYTPHLRPSGCWLCSFRHLMTVVLNNRQNDNR